MVSRIEKEKEQRSILNVIIRSRLRVYLVFSAGEEFDENVFEVLEVNVVLPGIVSGSDRFG